MMLETFFKRGASTYLASQQGKFKDIRGAMEGVFGWLEAEIKDWVDGVLQRDPMYVVSALASLLILLPPADLYPVETDLRQVVGILATLNRFIEQGERQQNNFVSRTLQKQYQKSLSTLERSCVRILTLRPFSLLLLMRCLGAAQKEQIRSIEQTKLTLKKRKGVVPFVRIFPVRAHSLLLQEDTR